MGPAPSKPAPRISITFPQPALTGVGAPLILLITVSNDTSEPLPAQRLQLLGDSYWLSTCSTAVPSIPAHSSCEPVTLELRCRETTDPALVPASFTLRLDSSNVTKECRVSFRTFTRRIHDYSPVGLPGANDADKLALLCFGLAGSGKSSFVNGVLTLMHEGDDISCIVPSGGTADHLTTSIRGYSVDSANIDLYDIWGLDQGSDSNHQEKLLQLLLQGWLPDGWTMTDQLRGQCNRLLSGSNNQHQRRIHGVLFFMAASSLHDDAELNLALRWFQKIKQLGYTPVVVLSLADKECPECRSDTLKDYPDLTALKNKAAEALGVGQKDIVHCVSYYSETTRKFEIDRLTYKILDMALHNARDFCSITQPLQGLQSILMGDWTAEDVELAA